MKEYFISYYFQRGTETGFGNLFVGIKKEDKISRKTLDRIEEEVKNQTRNNCVVVINFKEVD